MAVSTVTLATCLDTIAGKGIPDPRNQSGNYGLTLALRLATRVMSDLVSQRFNWPFNRNVAAPFYTNSWQQDYPQLAQAAGAIAWGDDVDYVDINNTTIPKPLNWDGAMTWRQGLSRTSITGFRPRNISWMYNSQLSWGTWPGASTTYFPLVTTGKVSQNPIMNFVDKNGNYLILTTFGITGLTAPFAVATAAEGVTVADGSCVWTVVSGSSQGYRIDTLPSATGMTLQIIPYYQLSSPNFIKLSQTLAPIPDDYSTFFDAGLEFQCLAASPNPGDRQRTLADYQQWLNSMEAMIKQANKSPDIYGLIPATSPVESRWDFQGPRTADRPF